MRQLLARARQQLLAHELGDAHILRNAGGRVTDDVVRSLVLSSHALGTREVVVIHHTGCGLFGATNDDLRNKVLEATGTGRCAHPCT